MKKKLRFRGISKAFPPEAPSKTKLQLEEEFKKQKAIVAATLRRNSNLMNMYESLRKKDKNYSQEVTDANKKTELVQKEFEEYKEKF